MQRAGAVGAESVCCFDARSRLGGSYANAEQSQLRVVAPVQGKRVDALTVHHLAQVRGFCFELRTFAGDHNCLGRHAGLKSHIHTNAILNVDLHRPGNSLSESLLFDGDAVASNFERARDILSVIISGERQLNAPIDVSYRDFGVRDQSAARIAHDSYNGASVLLRP